MHIFFRQLQIFLYQNFDGTLVKTAFRSKSNSYRETVVSIGRPEGEVPSMVVISSKVGPMGPRGRTIVLVAKHQKLRAAIKSSQSMLILKVESLIASKM